MTATVTYHLEYVLCGKVQCRKCRDGVGHGPYWYARSTIEGGKTKQTYIGKHLPAGAVLQAGPPIADGVRLRVSVLGAFLVERYVAHQKWRPLPKSVWKDDAKVLFCFLLSRTDRRARYQEVIDALWPSLQQAEAVRALERSVSSLQQVLPPLQRRSTEEELLHDEGGQLDLAGQAQIWVDADAFEGLLSNSKNLPLADVSHLAREEGENRPLPSELDMALALYRGDFLSDVQDAEWAVGRRRIVRRKWVGLLLDLSDQHMASGALSNAVEILDRLLAKDTANEAAIQRMLVALTQLQRRGEALHMYQRFTKALQQEHGLRPSFETVALYDALLRGEEVSLLNKGRESLLPVLQHTPSLLPEARHAKVRAVASATPIGRANQSPLVGREREIDIVRAHLTEVESSQNTSMAYEQRLPSQCVFLTGEAGIGKTRLAEEISRWAQQRGWLVAWSFAYSQERGILYGMWVDVLRKVIDFLEGGDILAQLSAELHPLLPELATFSPTRTPSTPALIPDPLRLYEATGSLLTSVSAAAPLLLVLDDVQWADESSCELLAYLARRLSGKAIVILGTCRDREIVPTHPLKSLIADRAEPQVTLVPMKPLSDEQIRSILPPLSESLLQDIQLRAAGNPLFAEELARVAPLTLPVELGASLYPSHLVQAHSIGSHLPDTIGSLFDLRLGKLSSSCQQLLSKASVLGGHFSFPVLVAMATPASEGSERDEDRVVDLLDEALREGILTEEVVNHSITYQFWHPLLVNHVYETTLSAARRAGLHRRAAEALRKYSSRSEEEEAASITHHLLHGGAEPNLIARFAELAGDRAYDLSAYRDAAKHYRTVVEQRKRGTRQNALVQDASLLEVLGECLRVSGEPEEARTYYEQALDAYTAQSQTATRPERQREAQIRALLACEVGLTWFDIGDAEKALHCYGHAERILHEAEVPSGYAWARVRHEQSYARWQEGMYDEARRLAEEALALFGQALNSPQEEHPSSLRMTRTRRTARGDAADLGRTHMLLGLISNSAGQMQKALQHLTTALGIFEEHDRCREIANVCCNLGDLYMRKALYSQAQDVLQRSRELAERMGDDPLISFVSGNLALLDLRRGSLLNAEKMFRHAIHLAERTENSAAIGLWSTYLAGTLQEQGKLEEAGALLVESLAILRQLRITPYIGLALLSVGVFRVSSALTDMLRGASTDESASRHLLWRARKVLDRVLSLEAIEQETRLEGLLTVGRIALLQEKKEEAEMLASQALHDAEYAELTWLFARAQCLQAEAFALQGHLEEASRAFERAISTFRTHEMRLEYGRSCFQYAVAMLRSEGPDRKTHHRGETKWYNYLREARQIFAECHASLDLQLAERVLLQQEEAPFT